MVRTYKFEYIITIISLSLLVSIAWYYLYLMASHPSMDGMMKSENSMSMSMDSVEMDSEQMNSMSMSMSMSMEMNNGNKSINFLMMPMTGKWNFNDFIVMNTMWIVMMFAMMMPSTYIFLNLFRLMRSKMQTVKYPTLELSLISLTYFIIWIIFSISACTAQYYLHNNGLVDMMGTLKSNTVSSITLLVAGIYQFTNLKQACLEKCRNPLSFIMGRNIHGIKDIISIGLSHGLYCLGCCWSLMALLFVNGVMNLTWVVILTIIILIEKLLPFEQLSSRFFGVLLVIWGLYLLI
jgi:predicted metal-binding membrane protein